MSEYGPILDSNNPLSLNRANPEHGNYCILTAELISSLSFFLHSYLVTQIVYTVGCALTLSLILLSS